MELLHFSRSDSQNGPLRNKKEGPTDQYAQLYSDDVVGAINGLNLPRYGLGNYIAASPHEAPTQNEGNRFRTFHELVSD